jgi:aminopeptidase N
MHQAIALFAAALDPVRVGHRCLIALILLCLPIATTAADQPVISHQISVTLDPTAGRISATDRLELPADVRQLVFLLHRGLSPRITEGDGVLERIGRDGHLERFRLTLSEGDTATLGYEGTIRHPFQSLQEGMGRSREQLVGTIGRDGVFLSGYTGWYPNTPDALHRMTLEVTMPAGWLAVSQGAGPTPVGDDAQTVRWVEEQPQDELYISAARFKLYRRPTPYGEAQAYLRLPDDDLANRYLDVTADYLARYSELIGPYPYAKFALIENFWETGYGMPSFTLLGSRVMRLPFILHSSYPHEILHNWWGNSVYVDYERGNWSEGLTAYLADHLNKVFKGEGATYRREQLQAYADYVTGGQDFPLVEFRGRHSMSSQAVGYGKMLMLTHMLRVQLGDDTFKSGLRTFFRRNLFRTASLDDLKAAFELASNEDLDAFFEAWTTRTGAATLKLGDTQVEQTPVGSYLVTGGIYQVQEAPAYPMTVPVVVHDERGVPRRVLATFNGRTARFRAEVAAPPVRIAVDPQFDTYRRLQPEESPASLSRLFGAEGGLIVLPATASEPARKAYAGLAEAWRKGSDRWQIVSDDALDALPDAGAVWLLGWENAFVDELTSIAPELAVDSAQRTLVLEGEPREQVSVALALGDGDRAVGWVAASDPRAIPGLARKLPHYRKSGYLTFTGDAPDNELRGKWPVGDSALSLWLSDARPTLRDPSRPALTPR